MLQMSYYKLSDWSTPPHLRTTAIAEPVVIVHRVEELLSTATDTAPQLPARMQWAPIIRFEAALSTAPF